MSASAPNTSANEMIHAIPPHSVNCESVSTSAVTRATNTPRFSSVCSAIDSSWMCSNVRTRSAISACSDAFTSRRAASAAREVGEDDQGERGAAQRCRRTWVGTPPSKPWSKICWTRTGVTSVATVTPSETTTVKPSPLRSSGRLVQPATQHGPCALEVRGDLEVLVGRRRRPGSIVAHRALRS